ncbi:unnamed protein product, partial [Closterium sp. NIES-53]
DVNGGQLSADDVVAHRHAAPLLAPRPTAGRLGTQLLGAVDYATGDDDVPATDWQEARPYAGAGVGLHGAIHGPGAAVRWEVGDKGPVGASPRCVAGEQGLGGARLGRQQDGHVGGAHLLRDAIAGAVDDRGAADREASGEGGSSRSAADRGAADGEVERGAVDEREVGKPVEGPTLAKQLVDDEGVDDEGELSAGEDSTNSDLVEVPVEKTELQRSGRSRRRPARARPRHARRPEHCWDIATMMVKEALASWKGKAMKVAMDEEIRSLIANGT